MSFRALSTLLIIAVLGAAAYWGLQGRSSDPEVTYVTSEATVGKLTEFVTATGSLNALVTVEVGSQISGRIDELLVDFNDQVTKGQVVAKLDRQSYEARLSEAQAVVEKARAGVAIKRAELERAQAELDAAEADISVLEARRAGAAARFDIALTEFERKKPLADRGLVAQEALDDLDGRKRIEEAGLREAEALLAAGRIRVEVARSNVARQEADLQNSIANIPQTEAALNLAAVELERTVIRAPIDGVVIRRNVSEGQTVAVSFEAPTLFTIAQDLREMELHARVDETDIGKIREGQTAAFMVDSYPGKRFTGQVVQVRKSPEIIQNVVTYPVVIRTRNDDQILLPGMTAAIQILVMETEPVLRIPLTATTFTPSQLPEGFSQAVPPDPSVWVLDPSGALRAVAIETGASDRSNIAVTNDVIGPGDAIVTGEIVAPRSDGFLGLRLGF